MAEIGPELKVSELHAAMAVTLCKQGQAVAVWVEGVTRTHVFFRRTKELHFVGFRTGKDLEQITDDAGSSLKIFRYQGDVK